MADRSLRFPRIPAIPGIGARPGSAPTPEQRRVSRAWSRPAIRSVNIPLLLWRLLWLPFWIGSDVPPPALPARNLAVPLESGLAGQQVVRMLDSIRRRVWSLWALTSIVRAAWLGALAACVWLLIERAGGPDVELAPLLWIGGGFLAVGMIFAAVNRPTRGQTARMLDRSFRLHERISTALGNLGKELPNSGERAQVTYLQVADAANVIAELRRHSAFRLRPPLRELVLALTCALTLAGLFFLRGIGGDIPALGAANVPAFAPAATRIRPPEATGNPGAAPGETGDGPTSEEVQARAQRSNEAQRDLSTLGQALDDHAVTRSAAEAIADGDYDEAAAELREVAADADQMSQESRSALADDLDQAADQMSPGSSSLSEASRTAADGLREGGETAQQGVNELGNAVQETGSDVASQQELRDQMTQAQAQESAQSSAEANPQEGQQGQESTSGDQSGQQTGEPGEAGSGEQASGDPQQGEGGEGQQPGAGEGQPAEPGGEGADAAPSDGAQQQSADRGSNPGGARDPGSGDQRGRDRQSSAEGAPGEGQPGSAPSPGSPGGQQASAPTDDSGSTDAAQQGQGAGSGQGESQEGQRTEGGDSTGQEPGAQGLPAEERVTESGPPPAAQDIPEPESGDGTIGLEDTGGGGIQTSTNAGSASAGSGTGVMTASGTTQQQEVDAAGPDSNRVPADKRDVVEDYFSEPGAGE